jgi:hypothetical protein
MNIHLDLSSLRRVSWQAYLVRFVLGGAMTVLSGLIAKAFGPVIGGLFLAFPATFPASATLSTKISARKSARPVSP